MPKYVNKLRTWSNIQNPVEQQNPGGATGPWVIVNRTKCAWDADDRDGFSWRKTIEPGEIISYTICVICDSSSHYAGIAGYTGRKRNYFRCSMTFSNGHVVQPTIIEGKRGKSGRACMTTPEFDKGQLTNLPEIPNSGGGHGLLITVTFCLENIGPRTGTFNLQGEIAVLAEHQHNKFCPCPWPINQYGECTSWGGGRICKCA